LRRTFADDDPSTFDHRRTRGGAPLSHGRLRRLAFGQAWIDFIRAEAIRVVLEHFISQHDGNISCEGGTMCQRMTGKR
jgi:hypothetical protein